MLTQSKEHIEKRDKDYPGIKDTIYRFEALDLPPCPECKSDNTASVQCGLIGRTLTIAAATTKFHLTANGPLKGKYFCNECRNYFD